MNDQTTTATETAELKRTALYDVHVKLGAKIVPFAGYQMPVSYRGIVAEHAAVRERVGIFDVSHMGEVTVKGPAALDFVQKITVNDASSLAHGQAQYSAMCLESGGIVDDLLVYRRGDDDFFLVINASNIAKDFAWMQQNALEGMELKNVSDDYTLLAVQGPKSADTLRKLASADLDAIAYYHFVDGEVAGVPMIISRTGYTGELGFELYFSSDTATGERVWNAIMEAGAEFGIEPVGLGARDTLRLEMGYCLYGNDIDESTNTIEAGLGWITKINKGVFNGRDVIVKVKEEKPHRKLVGFEMNERGIPRQHYDITVNGERVGEVTSGTSSPTMGKGIGMGYVESRYTGIGSIINVMIRGQAVPATIVKLPILKKG
ncbi:MAG: glycine cleavage system aminomethyltransferase GcvT [Bacteroidetes bacterium]|nr:glycine cleavage system aminomethyltransferase GcvT [Bacteroidota bacterium]